MTRIGAPRIAGLAALAVVALAAAGCSGSSNGGPDTKDSSSGPASGTMTVTIAGTAAKLSIQLCVQAGGGLVNVTAQGSDKPPSTLVANVAPAVKSSTAVYTTIKSDNTFTTYSMSSGAVASQSKAGEPHVTMSGKATKVDHDATGNTVGSPTTVDLKLDGTCASVQSQQPAPQFGSPSPTS